MYSSSVRGISRSLVRRRKNVWIWAGFMDFILPAGLPKSSAIDPGLARYGPRRGSSLTFFPAPLCARRGADVSFAYVRHAVRQTDLRHDRGAVSQPAAATPYLD